MNSNNPLVYYYLYEIYVDDPESSINRHYYYGKRESYSLDDGYYGSGKIINLYMNKHGISKLRKKILYLAEDRESLKVAEQLLIEEKKKELGDLILNLHEGGSGGHWVEYCDDAEYERRCRKVREGIYESTSPEDRSRRAKYAGDCKKNATPEERAVWSENYKQGYINMSPEDKKAKYNKVADSLKRYYADEANIDMIAEKQQKNKLSNIESSKRWREEFNKFFGRTPEYFRKLGKMKASLDLFRELKEMSKEEAVYEVNRFMESISC